MSRAVLIKLESDRDEETLAPPYGILYLASALEKAGLSVKLIHERGTREAARRIGRQVIAEKPVFAGFSCLTGPALRAALEASRLIRHGSSIPVVWGGVHPTLLPEQVLDDGAADFVVLGEGEETAVELARALQAGTSGRPDWAAIRGIAFREAGGVKITAPRPLIADLDAYEPAWHLLDRKRYVYRGRYYYSEGGSQLPGEKIAGLITSRGCPWRCGYCFHETVHRRTFRAHSAERVIAEIATLKADEGVTTVNFEDANFFVDRQRALRIVREAGVAWGSSMRADTFSAWGEDFAREISDLGCRELQIGAESGSRRVLDLMRKDINPDQIRESARLGQKYGIRILFSFMMGLPGETREEVMETLALMDALRAVGDKIVTNGPFFYFPFPGTALYDQAVASGFRPPGRTTDWNFRLWGIHQPLAPYVPRGLRFVEHYRRLAWGGEGRRGSASALLGPLAAAARWRWRKRCFRFPLDYHLPRMFLNLARFLGRRKSGAGRGVGIPC
jgi:radical SAM superfamily enzyme YgiQ (UPF0313 family)